MSAQPWQLITLPISHYCEKVRWGLDRLNLSYVEEPHLLMLHRKITESLGGQSVPVLVTDEIVLTDSTDILKYIDAFAAPRSKLYPSDPESLKAVEDLETLFNQTLGPATRRWGYSHLLTADDILQASWCAGISDRERALYPKMLPKLKLVVQDALEISDVSAVQSFDKIHQVFATVEEYLSDGRPYLLGESMTAADLTFAALAAPIISPDEHPMKLNQDFSLPDAMTRDVLRCRKMRAGEFVLRMYRDRI